MQLQTPYMGLGPRPGPMGGLPGRAWAGRAWDPGPGPWQPPHGPGRWAQAHVRSLHLHDIVDMLRYTYMYIVTIYV